ncbi:MAG: trigger factor [Thermodesulfovibrionales bacterium]|nr:trigger factor [Thermodesulfovibrionales bacterium]
MLKAVEDINQTKKRLRIEIPSDLIEREIKNSLEKLRHTVKIPGFRPGKAPVNLIEKRFGKQVEAEVLEKVVPEQLGNAIREAAIDPVTMPVLEEEFDYKRNNPLAFAVTLEVKPKIENLAYENITVKDIPVNVEESDVEDALKALQNKKAVFEVADKLVEMDDFVSFEYVDSEIAGGEDISSVKETISKMGNEILPLDIMEKVIGKQKGDIIEFATTFPATASKELAGRTAQIKVKISEVKKKTLPEIDDEFAKDLGYETMTDLREKAREKIYAAKTEHIRKIQKAEIIRKLVESSTFEVPESLVGKEIEAIMMHKSISGSKEDSVSQNSVSDTIEPVSSGQEAEKNKEEDPQAELRSKAVRNVQAHFILDTIGRKEGIVVSDNEVDERIASLAQKLSATPESVRNYYLYREGSLDGLKHSIMEDKVMDALLAKATIEKENT